jgi:hypothetical protein
MPPHDHEAICAGAYVCHSSKQTKAPQIIFSPAGLVFDHAPQRLGRERVSWAMKRHRHAPAVGVAVVLMAPFLGAQGESVMHQRTH